MSQSIPDRSLVSEICGLFLDACYTTNDPVTENGETHTGSEPNGITPHSWRLKDESCFEKKSLYPKLLVNNCEDTVNLFIFAAVNFYILSVKDSFVEKLWRNFHDSLLLSLYILTLMHQLFTVIYCYVDFFLLIIFKNIHENK